uniref:PLAT domain-containing protein n=1 Tax=Schistocephalus solidus TaxID=70667 RepID=A0A183SZF7_SCHSO
LQRFRPFTNPHLDLSNKRHRPLPPAAEMQNGPTNPPRGRSRLPVRAKHGLPAASVPPTRQAPPPMPACSETATSGSSSIRSSRSMGSLGDKQAKRRVPGGNYWQVFIQTGTVDAFSGEEYAVACSANIFLTVQGTKSCTAPLLLQAYQRPRNVSESMSMGTETVGRKNTLSARSHQREATRRQGETGARRMAFEPGTVEEFEVNLGNIGEIIKIRLSHDNSGDSPDLLIAMVRMRPVSGTALQLSAPPPRSRNLSSSNNKHAATATTGTISSSDAEILTFPCGRWMSRRYGDGDTTCEIPSPLSAALVLRERQRRLNDTQSHLLRGRLRNLTAPASNGVARTQGDLATLIIYRVVVKTSDLWGAGTQSSVNVTIVGEFGDTGPRLLWKAEDDSREPFQRGQTDVFYLEAVYLGELKSIRVWLEGEQRAASSWRLDWIQIIEKAPGVSNHPNSTVAAASESIYFACDRWINASKQGHMTELELFSTHLSETELTAGQLTLSPSKAAQLWKAIQWKFQPDTEVVFYCHNSGAPMQADSLGNLSVTESGNRPHDTSDKESKDGDPDLKDGSGFVIRPQLHSWVKLELINTTDFDDRPQLTFDSHGRLGIRPIRPSGAQEYLWMPYVKGSMRDEGIIMLCTSYEQAICPGSTTEPFTTGLEEDTHPHAQIFAWATGARDRNALWRVHVARTKGAQTRGLRRFESVCNPGRFLRIVSAGECDIMGDGGGLSYFRVHRNKARGFVVLESFARPNLFVSILSNGFVTTSNQGDGNNDAGVCLYPEVVECKWFKRVTNERYDQEDASDSPKFDRSLNKQSCPINHYQPKAFSCVILFRKKRWKNK